MRKILIVDDHAVVRRGLKQILAEEDDLAVFGEAIDARELLSNVYKKDWDIVILDITLPDRSGLDVLRELKHKRPKLPVLILSVHPEEQYAIRAIKSGADGYLTKRSVPQELVKAVKKVSHGGKYVSPALAEKLADTLREGVEQPIHEKLSNREYQVTCMIASGKSSKEIARELYLSEKTIRTYRARVLEKMKFKSNAELIYYAVKNRLVD
jgi:two-component system, NarL family, invasion response regulator UvrY